MPSFRRPRGTYARNTADWFSDKLCYGAWYSDFAVGSYPYQSIGLYNNSSTGDKFYIWAISLAMDGANVAAGVILKGTIGAQVANCFYIDALQGQSDGLIYLQTNGPNAPPSAGRAVPANTQFLIGTSFGAPAFQPNIPICILNPGYSCNLQSDIQTTDAGVSFWFTPMKGN
jgi:hypothetical protein